MNSSRVMKKKVEQEEKVTLLTHTKEKKKWIILLLNVQGNTGSKEENLLPKSKILFIILGGNIQKKNHKGREDLAYFQVPHKGPR